MIREATYTLSEERAIAERAEVIIGELRSGTAMDGEAITALRVARLCATRANSSSSTAAVNDARREITLASLALIETIKNHGDRDQKLERARTAVEAWRRETRRGIGIFSIRRLVHFAKFSSTSQTALKTSKPWKRVSE